MIELKELRDRFGNDGRAINRHSVRYYQWSDPKQHSGFFMIDRTLDGVPPFYELLDLDHDPRTDHKPYIPRTIKIDGQRYFGDGLSWRDAEIIARKEIERLCEV